VEDALFYARDRVLPSAWRGRHLFCVFGFFCDALRGTFADARGDGRALFGYRLLLTLYTDIYSYSV